MGKKICVANCGDFCKDAITHSPQLRQKIDPPSICSVGFLLRVN